MFWKQLIRTPLQIGIKSYTIFTYQSEYYIDIHDPLGCVLHLLEIYKLDSIEQDRVFSAGNVWLQHSRSTTHVLQL